MPYVFSRGDGTQANPYKISTLDDLNGVRDYLSAYFELANDIDASSTSTWDSGVGWLPIGDSTTPFTGSFDGKGYKITGLYINRPTTDNVGLFGVFGSNTISNLKMKDINITGKSKVAGIAGFFNGGSATVTKCNVSGVITAKESYLGSIVGYAYNTNDNINNCSSSCTLNTTYNPPYVGGIVGRTKYIIDKCYFVGVINKTAGDYYDAIATKTTAGVITNCYWNTDTCGLSSSTNGTGKTTAELKTQSTFTDWNFQTVWYIKSGEYPALRLPPSEATIPSSAGQWMEWDITNHVKDAIANGLSSVDLLVKMATETASSPYTAIYFNSKESSTPKPVIIIDQSEITANKDSYILKGTATNYGSGSQLWVKDESTTTRRFVISFPLTGITVLENAKLKLYLASINDISISTGKIVQVYKLTRPDWIETEATWNNYKSGSAWTTAGGDYEALIPNIAPSSSGTQETVYSDCSRPVIVNESLDIDTIRRTALFDTINTDTERKASSIENILADTKRDTVLTEAINFDTLRPVALTETILSDTLRQVVHQIVEVTNADTLRMVVKGETIAIDTARRLSIDELTNVDTMRRVSIVEEFLSDVLRQVVVTNLVNSDTSRTTTLFDIVNADTLRKTSLNIVFSSDTMRKVISAEDIIVGVINLLAEFGITVSLQGEIITTASLEGGVNLTKENQNFDMYAGDTKQLNFTVDLPEGATLVGATVKWVLRRGNSVVSKDTVNGITVTGSNTCRVGLEPEDTMGISGLCVHELEVTDALGNVSTVARGTANIREALIN